MNWPVAPLPVGVDEQRLAALTDRAFGSPGDSAIERTFALVAVYRGAIVWEHYGPTAGPDTPLVSWSMAKSFTQAVIGCLVADGRLDVHAPAPIAEWADDERSAITIDQLLTMTSGLRFVEDYVDDGVSDVIEMLFGAGKHDAAAYARALPLVHEPGTVFNYSSGTTNILCGIIADLVGSEAEQRAYFAERLFDPLGMTSADPRFDDAGTFVGSSFLYATARDFCRFGELYRLGGMWEGRRLLPADWTDEAARPVDTDTSGESCDYGRHWWLWDDDTYAAHGYEGQFLAVSPMRELVLCRLGKTPAIDEGNPVHDWLTAVRDCFPSSPSTEPAD